MISFNCESNRWNCMRMCLEPPSSAPPGPPPTPPPASEALPTWAIIVIIVGAVVIVVVISSIVLFMVMRQQKSPDPGSDRTSNGYRVKPEKINVFGSRISRSYCPNCGCVNPAWPGRVELAPYQNQRGANGYLYYAQTPFRNPRVPVVTHHFPLSYYTQY